MDIRLTGGVLIDGTGAGPREATVVIRNQRISEIDAPGEVASTDDVGSPAQGAPIITLDAAGKYILPGLVNMHEHLTYRELKGPTEQATSLGAVEATVVAVRNAMNALARGWTTVVDMAAAHDIAITLKRLIRDGVLPGPRVLAVGQPICVSGGHASGGGLCIEADGPDECRKAARRILASGADLVKVMASHDPWPMPGEEQTRAEMGPEEIWAVYQEAQRWGRLRTCHVMGTSAIRNVLEANVDIMHHGVYLNEAFAKEMADRGVTYCPTASAYCRQTMDPAFERGQVWAQEHEALVKPHQEAVSIAVDVGVRIVVGTDSTGSYAEELHLLRAAGMQPMETILAATKNAAEALGLDDQIGTVEPGKLADLVVVDGDPLADESAIQRVSLVIKQGEIYRPEQLVLERDDDVKWISRHLNGR